MLALTPGSEVDWMADCLTPLEIEHLLAGTLSAEDQGRVAAHVRACEKCRGRSSKKKGQRGANHDT